MQNITLIILLLLAAASAATAGEIKPFYPEKVTWDTIDEYCYTNARLLTGKPVKGVLFNFHGAGGGARRSPESPAGVALAGDGILEIYPYGNEMYFMHEIYAAQVDHMADVIFAALELPAGVPKVFSGDSMGGDGALCYAVYSKYRPAGVAAICPTTNLNDRAKNGLRDRFARIYASFEGDLDTLMFIHSPINMFNRMPDVPYYIMAGGQDPIPNFTRDIIRTVSRMKKRGLGVTFVYLETMGHCNSPAEETAKYNRFIYDRFGFPAEYDIYKGSTWEPK